jgi:hypothetical protein
MGVRLRTYGTRKGLRLPRPQLIGVWSSGLSLIFLVACSAPRVSSTDPPPSRSGAGGTSLRDSGAAAGGSGGAAAGGAGPGGGGNGGALTANDSGVAGTGTSSGGTPAAGGHSGAGGTSGVGTDGGGCMAVETAQAIEGVSHTNGPCEHVSYLTNPPSSGTHYGIWTEFKTYDTPVPEGFWVHSLEHGAVVISYNCPEGCAAEVARAQAMIDSLPVDPLCYPTGGTSLRRLVMTPDPHLTTRFAASAWGFTLRASCFDPTRFRAFVDSHYAHTVEDFCSAGAYQPADYPANCGE